MRSNNFVRRIGRVFGLIGSASRVAGAIRGDRSPQPRDLVRLGIDPAAFTSMGHG
jgi:hypothetical protein